MSTVSYTTQEDGSAILEQDMGCFVCGYGPEHVRIVMDEDLVAWSRACPICGTALLEVHAAFNMEQKIRHHWGSEKRAKGGPPG